MKGPIVTSLALLLWSAVSLCLASEAELLRALNELTSAHESESFKQLPPSKAELSKKALDSKACGDYADARRDSSGTVDFPAGNSDYSAFADCAWAIMGGAGKTVSITFTFMDIEQDNPCDDYIRLYAMTETSPRNYKYTPLTDKICPDSLKKMNPTHFTSTSDGIYVEFKSDWWDNEPGFIFNYQVTGKSPSPTPRPGGSSGNNIPGAGGGSTVPGGSDDISNLNCNFDKNSMCGWNNLNGNDINWTAKRASDSPWRTWGHQDHTTGRDSGYYAYLYTNGSPRNNGGALTSHELSAGPSQGRCLTFYYNMMQTDGVFKVILKYSGGGKQTVLQRDGSQGNGWLKGTITLVSKQPYRIQFLHRRGSMDVETGLALDDISITTSKCYSRLNSCGTNIYGTRKKRDLRSLLKAIAEIKEEKKEKLEEDLEEQLEDRILGGQESKKGQFPWIVHIRIFPKGVSAGTYLQCGGSIIDEEWILTAAHCFESDGYTYDDPDKIRIYLGEHNTHYKQVEESQFVLVPQKVIIHPDRNADAKGIYGHQYDITLLKLKYKLTFTDDVNAICLPDGPFPAGTSCIAAGWGLNRDGETSEELLHLAKNIQSDSQCSPYTITEDMLCAIAPSGVGDVCQGDSGGPLVCKQDKKYELAGLVSFGDACASRRRTSGVYADAYYFIPFIKSVID